MKGGCEIGARISQCYHRGQVYCFLIRLQECRGGFAVGTEGPVGEALVGVVGQLTVTVIVNRVNGNQAKPVLHPDLIDLDVGVQRNGVLQVFDVGDDDGVDVLLDSVQGVMAIDMNNTREHTPKQGVPEFNLSIASFYQPVGLLSAGGFIVNFVVGKAFGIDNAEGKRCLFHKRFREITLNHDLFRSTGGQNQKNGCSSSEADEAIRA